MIIQTGMRTDIPAFYPEWLVNRIREGYVLVRNPYNPVQVTRYSLSPDVVDLIAFCTKNPAPMLLYMEHLKPYGQYWFVTSTPYGTDIEPNGPDKWKVIASFPEARAVSKKDRIAIGKAFIEIADRYGMTIRPCAEGNELEAYGADCSGCMAVNTYETALHCRLEVPKRKTNQRNGSCACLLGVDIGAYDTCGHLCRYCYANTDAALVKDNMRMHNPKSPFLLGESMPDDNVHQAEQKSWIDRQMRLELCVSDSK